MRRTRLVFFSIVAITAAIILTSRLMIIVNPANVEPTPTGSALTPDVASLLRGWAKLPDLRKEPSDEPLRAEVVDVVPAVTSIGSIYFVGEVVNTGNRPIAKPETIVSLLDADGNRLLFETGYTVHDVVAPHETVPVVVLFTNPPPAWKSFEVFLQAQEPTGREYMAYTGFTALNAVLTRDEFSGFVVTGEVQNTGTLHAEFVQAVVSLYGEDKKIVGVGSAYVEYSKLDPNATSPFTVRIMNLVAPAASFRLQFVGHAK